MKGRWLRCVGVGIGLAVAVGLAGCATSAPASRYYLLAPPIVGDTAEEIEGVRVGIETFAADPPFDQPRLVYRVGRDAGEVGFYHHHRWAAPPGRLVTTGLAAGLRGLDGVASIEPASVTGAYDVVIGGRVVAIEEIDLPGRQVARVCVDLEVHDVASGTILWAGLLDAEVDGRADDAADVMARLREAFAELVADARVAVTGALERRSSAR